MWQEEEALLRRDAAAAAAFLPGGRAPREGELVRLPDLARTLGTLAEEGPRAFYEGEIAERIVAATRAAGGFLELGGHGRAPLDLGRAALAPPTAASTCTSCRRRRPASPR